MPESRPHLVQTVFLNIVFSSRGNYTISRGIRIFEMSVMTSIWRRQASYVLMRRYVVEEVDAAII